MANVYRAKIDLKSLIAEFKPIFVQYDHACLEIELLDNGRTYDLSNVEYVEFTHVLQDDTVIIHRGEIIEKGNKKLIFYEYVGSEMDLIGTSKTSFALFGPDRKKVSSHVFEVQIVEDLREETFNPAEPNFGLLQTLVADVDELKDRVIEGGPQGERGEDGYTPVKGIDYFDGERGEKGEKGDPSPVASVNGKIGDVVITADEIDAVSIAEFINYTSQDTLSRYASDVDSKDIYRVVEFKRSDNTLYMKSTLSNPDAKGNYQTCTWNYYNPTGDTIIKTIVWTFTYDAKENIISKVVT